jgi:serine/threonine protein kinase
LVAIKVQKLKNERKEADLTKEIELHRIVNGHPNIVTLRGYFKDDLPYGTPESENGISTGFIVMDFESDGNLLELVNQVILGEQEDFTHAELRYYIKSLVHAIKYMHEKGVYHSDIKLENLLLGQDPQIGYVVKICDFGLASNERIRSKATGTKCYFSPEMFEEPQYDSVPADVWAAGICLWIMIAKRRPFMRNKNSKTPDFHTLRTRGLDAEPGWDAIRQYQFLDDLMRGMLNPDPRRRLTIDQILRHDFMTCPLAHDKFKNVWKRLEVIREIEVLCGQVTVNSEISGAQSRGAVQGPEIVNDTDGNYTSTMDVAAAVV